jgi:exocyst complex protein 7
MGDASWIEQRQRMGFRQGANWGNGRTISLTLLRSVCPAGVLLGLTWLQEEYGLLTLLAPLPGQPHLSSTYITLLIPLTTLFNTTLSSLTTLIKRSLHKYTFHALASYSALSVYQDRWDDLITRRVERRDNELKEGLHALRGVCLRSFPEFIADLKLTGLGRGGEIGTGCADFTISVRHSPNLV